MANRDKRSSVDTSSPLPKAIVGRRYRFGVLTMTITFVTVLIACGSTYAMWDAYVDAPWTRDGSVRVYVVTLAPEVSGQVVRLPVVDNEFVHKGDLVLSIDKRDYEIAVKVAEADLSRAKADSDNKAMESDRRSKLDDLAASTEEKQSFAGTAQMALGAYNAALANLRKAQLNLERTDLRSPVNGWITNLQTREGNFVSTAQRALSLVDSDSFWVEGYFEETKIARIKPGATAKVRLLGYSQVMIGHVESIARGIVVSNAQADASGLANVNPVFTWVRLAQRIPVRLHIDALPEGIQLAGGMTASIEIEPAPPNGH